MRQILLVSWCLAALAITSLESRAQTVRPSFDCGRASASSERLICASDELAGLDRSLDENFRALREPLDAAGRTSLVAAQKRWLQQVVATCAIPVGGDVPADKRPAAIACLAGAYRARIAELQGQVRPAAPTAAANAAPHLSKQLFRAQGDNEALLTLPEFGRYAVAVKSGQGTALQLVDTMAGPDDMQGIAGAQDGRLDDFLDRGTYKIRLSSDPKGSGDAELSVVASRELQPTPVKLVELKPVVAELDDHEQRSWWLEVKEQGPYAFEAAGRHLADLRLWRDGTWLIDATPSSIVRDPGGG
ncbi:MAG TPA: lysozyme inhibitor LprI family protein, partial [Stellaceae bacterium]|nr:lysozyme inhibitor LprI family protein [Stellaceae bacterium]